MSIRAAIVGTARVFPVAVHIGSTCRRIRSIAILNANAISRLGSGRHDAAYVFTVGSRCVAAAILAAVEGGILPPGSRRQILSEFPDHTRFPPGRMPGSTAGKMPAATVNTYDAALYGSRDCRRYQS